MSTYFIFDTETHPILPGLLAPPLVCLSGVHRARPSVNPPAPFLVDRHGTVDHFRAGLDSGATLVGHNVAYDMAVLCNTDNTLLLPVFQAYADGRVSDTRIREKLLDLSVGKLNTGEAGAGRQLKYTMEALLERRFGEDHSAEKRGPDAWRLRYRELEDIPVEDWPPEAASYALGDATDTWRLWEHQALDTHTNAVQADGRVTNERETAAFAFAGHLACAWGVRTDPAQIDALSQALQGRIHRVTDALADPAVGIFRPDGSKDMKRLRAIIEGAYAGQQVPQTEKGSTATDKDTLLSSPARGVADVPGGMEDAQPHVWLDGSDPSFFPELPREVKGKSYPHPNMIRVPVLHALASISADKHNYETYLEVLGSGTTRPITPGLNELLESGRASNYKPSLQVMPRDGGYRECLVPRPGFIYVGADYSYSEICALAQTLLSEFGQSAMAEGLIAGRDPHMETGADLMGVSYEEFERLYKAGDEAAAQWRQAAKVLNFGVPGGMGPATLVVWAKATYRHTFGVTAENPHPSPKEQEQAARALKNRFLDRYPEMRGFFKGVSQLTESGSAVIAQPGSGRLRGGLGFCDGCNTLFQGPAADGAKWAFFCMQMECYTGTSPLWKPTPEAWTTDDVTDVAHQPLWRHEDGILHTSPHKSPLYGSRGVIFVHDEFLIESPEGCAHEAALRLQQVMVEGMRRYLPDIPVKAGPALMRRWSKKAKATYNEAGRLIPWEDKKK